MLPESQRLPKSMRLNKPADFRRVFSAGKRLRSPAFTVIAVKNAEQYARLGLAISRKSAPRAVDRNRIKRLIRESFRHKVRTLPPQDIVIQASPKARTEKSAKLVLRLDAVWNQLS